MLEMGIYSKFERPRPMQFFVLQTKSYLRAGLIGLGNPPIKPCKAIFNDFTCSESVELFYPHTFHNDALRALPLDNIIMKGVVVYQNYAPDLFTA